MLQRNYNLENIPAHVIYYGGIKNANKTEGIILWEDDHSINLANWTIGNVTLLKENIIRYSIKGDLYNEIHITGGNTKAAKFGDVVGGALLAGEMGAAVQLGGKTSQLKTDNVIIDNRKTILEANIDGELRHIFFDSKVYDILLRGLPDKEISFVGNDNTKTSNTNIYDKLRELAKLKGEGIISEKEFQEKKTSLLNKL